MNPSDPRSPWSRLITAARQRRDERDAHAPFGFSTRIAARAFDVGRQTTSLLERFAFRAMGFACLLALVSVATNYRALAPGHVVPTPHFTEDASLLPFDDAIAAVLEGGD